MSYAEPCDLCGEDTQGRFVYDDNPIILCLKCDEGDLKTTERFQRKGYRQALADVRREIESFAMGSVTRNTLRVLIDQLEKKAGS